MSDTRVLVVSNRLPVSVQRHDGRIRLERTTVGLATGPGSYREVAGGLWIGWLGDVSQLTADQRLELEQECHRRAIAPVHLSRDHIDRYYHGFANRVLWPFFHYLIDRVPVDAAGWDAYREVNEAFADVVAREYRAGDTIWIHDYQLMLLPALLRARLPSARIGFFLHIPFPSSEVFRILPWRSHILSGMLGADVVGFQTSGHLRHFLASLLYIDGVERHVDRVRVGNRDVRLGVFPIAIDAAAFSAAAGSIDVQTFVGEIRHDAGGRRIVLGIDCLDSTKGIPRRLQAIERLLENNPKLRDRIRYIQVAVPSRVGLDCYARFRRQVEESGGRINGQSGMLRSASVHHIHRSVSQTELIALFCAADVMLVTTLRDGMNLVAKEFVASRVDESGVLVLSEFAGAAAELDGAVTVNPYDVDAVTMSLGRALSMSPDERRSRMRRLRRRVFDYDVHQWARAFVERVDMVPPRSDIARASPARAGAADAARGGASNAAGPRAARLRELARTVRTGAGTGTARSRGALQQSRPPSRS